MPTFPVIHLNGSGKFNLLNQLGPAVDALYLALDKVRQTAPHGRDYYPTDPDGSKLQAAIEEHKARLDKLASVLEELQEIAIHVSESP